MSAAVYRIKRRPPGYTQIDNRAIRDRQISFKATGVLAYILSLPEGEPFPAEALAETKGQEGRDAIRAAFAELREAGYMRQDRERREGRWVTVTVVAESPELLAETSDTGDGFSGPCTTNTGDGFSGVGKPVRIPLPTLPIEDPHTPAASGEGASKGPSIEDITAVYEAWKEATNHPRAKLDTKRRNIIAARLKDGYTVAELTAAVRGITRSAFHMGENAGRTRYDSLPLILRDADHVERFANLENQHRRRAESNGGRESWMDRSVPLAELDV